MLVEINVSTVYSHNHSAVIMIDTAQYSVVVHLFSQGYYLNPA